MSENLLIVATTAAKAPLSFSARDCSAINMLWRQSADVSGKIQEIIDVAQSYHADCDVVAAYFGFVKTNAGGRYHNFSIQRLNGAGKPVFTKPYLPESNPAIREAFQCFVDRMKIANAPIGTK